MGILRLKEILKQKNITGKQLAEKIGISITGMSNIVKGQSLPRQEVLLEIAKVLDIDIKDLFNSTKDTENIYLIVKDELHKFSSVEELKNYVDTL